MLRYLFWFFVVELPFLCYLWCHEKKHQPQAPIDIRLVNIAFELFSKFVSSGCRPQQYEAHKSCKNSRKWEYMMLHTHRNYFPGALNYNASVVPKCPGNK